MAEAVEREEQIPDTFFDSTIKNFYWHKENGIYTARWYPMLRRAGYWIKNTKVGEIVRLGHLNIFSREK